MQWSSQQDMALKAVNDWLAAGCFSAQQVFRLFGYAGTGKTTLAQHFASGVDGLVLFAAFTGKAASVLRSKGCPDASTIHSLIYTPHDKSRLKLVQMERQLVELRKELVEMSLDTIKNLKVQRLEMQINEERQALAQPAFSKNVDSHARQASLIVIDECSMVDARIGNDLLSFNVPVLVLGDPAQLPPVGSGGYFTEHEPDFMLTEIHRQAAENPVIELATLVRQGDQLKPGHYGESLVLSPGESAGPAATEADQMLVGKNATRHAYNRRMRSLVGLDNGPSPGEKLVCLRNNHDVGILNGSQWEVESVTFVDDDILRMELDPIDGVGESQVEVEVWADSFYGNLKDMDWGTKKGAEEFDYGYAMTCHKAQGSQWNNVFVKDESRVFRDNRARWLYTAITRAAEKVTVVL